MDSGAATQQADERERLLEAVAALLRELGRDPSEVDLDARLDADLGLDSLTRLELLARVEQAFDVRVAERAVAEAETPRDLLQAVHAARAGARPVPPPSRAPVPAATPGPVRSAPQDTPTLVDALEWHAAQHPQRVHVHLYGEDGEVVPLTYGELMDEASRLAGGLVARGLMPGESVAIMLPTGREYLQSFLAVLLAGGTPVPIYPPARAKQIEEHFRRHARILHNARARVLVTFEPVKRLSRLLTARVSGLETLVTPRELAASVALDVRPRLGPADVAFLQYTSGSTGDPKGVVLTHGNILASLRSMRRALGVGTEDVFVSWLPLYHDMGLIGAWLGSLVVGFPLVLMSPLTFLARPQRWLQTIERFRGTVSGGPNFAYELCNRRVSDEDIDGLDLSSWRLAFNGAEPVSANTLHRFAERFSRAGFDPRAMTPVYGLAEATLGVAFTPVGRGPRIERIDRGLFHRTGVAQTASDDDALALVSSGVAIPDFEVRIVDGAGREAGDREEGEVEFRGPGVTSGYLRNPEASRGLFHGDWARSGDRGYLADGELFITGRDKDVVIRAGRNLYPYALEQAVGEVEGVRRGCVAVFGGEDPTSGTERLVVLAETRETDPQRRATMRASIERLTLEHLELPADEVLLAPPQTVLKTSSGKIRRSALAAQFARGRLGSRSRSPWLQVLRLGLDSLMPALYRLARWAGRRAYALRFALTLAANVAWVWPAVVLLPGRRRRWRTARLAARCFLRMAGIRLDVEGEPEWAAGRGIVLANHQSYLDGLVLLAVLAEPAAFVAKHELRRSAFARPFLDGIGVLYVDRFDRAGSVEAARAVTDALVADDRIVFFPEGTFHRMPGLLPFQLGAFDAAVAAGARLYPVVLAGTREVLRGDDLAPRRHPVKVRFLPAEDVPAAAPEARWSAAVQLRDAVRARMLAATSEPDLATRDALRELAARRQPASAAK
jgi:acyl carrier protein